MLVNKKTNETLRVNFSDLLTLCYKMSKSLNDREIKTFFNLVKDCIDDYPVQNMNKSILYLMNSVILLNSSLRYNFIEDAYKAYRGDTSIVYYIPNFVEDYAEQTNLKEYLNNMFNADPLYAFLSSLKNKYRNNPLGILEYFYDTVANNPNINQIKDDYYVIALNYTMLKCLTDEEIYESKITTTRFAEFPYYHVPLKKTMLNIINTIIKEQNINKTLWEIFLNFQTNRAMTRLVKFTQSYDYFIQSDYSLKQNCNYYEFMDFVNYSYYILLINNIPNINKDITITWAIEEILSENEEEITKFLNEYFSILCDQIKE